jgi:hypothetical protein
MDKKQTYKITIIAETDNNDPKDWLSEALEEGWFKFNLTKVYGTEVEAIDKEAPIHKWIKDFK